MVIPWENRSLEGNCDYNGNRQVLNIIEKKNGLWLLTDVWCTLGCLYGVIVIFKLDLSELKLLTFELGTKNIDCAVITLTNFTAVCMLITFKQ